MVKLELWVVCDASTLLPLTKSKGGFATYSTEKTANQYKCHYYCKAGVVVMRYFPSQEEVNIMRLKE